MQGLGGMVWMVHLWSYQIVWMVYLKIHEFGSFMAFMDGLFMVYGIYGMI